MRLSPLLIVSMASSWSALLAAQTRTIPVHLQILGLPVANEWRAPTVRLQGREIVVTGTELQRYDAPLQGLAHLAHVDPSGVLDLTLFLVDSGLVAGMGAPGWRQVRYQAQVGPLMPGQYRLRILRYDTERQRHLWNEETVMMRVP